jgi:myo-inositol-1(or 4)-monophosphatase
MVGRGEHRLDEIPPLPPGARAVGVGSVAYRLALLAQGKGDAVVTAYGRSEWDVAAGAALCHAAGLRVTDVLGAPLRFNQPEPNVRGLLVAAPGLHEHMATYLRRPF